MAYAAVISLKQTIKRHMKSSNISITPKSSEQTIGFLYQQIRSLKAVLEKLDSISSDVIINKKRVNSLDAQIREAVFELEDVIESHVKISHYPLDLEELKQDIDSFTQKLNRTKVSYIHELRYPLPEEEGDDRVILPSRNNESKMVGLSDQFSEIRNRLTEIDITKTIVSLVGMAGIGKTTLAKKLFQDPLVSSHFDKRAFVTIGQKFRVEDVLLDILKQVNPYLEMLIMDEGDEKLAGLHRMIDESLRDRTYLIVLDDVWDIEIQDKFTSLFAWRDEVSRLLVTTRLHHVAEIAQSNCKYNIRLLDKKESWDLLRHKVFDEMPCPHELEKAGKKIADHCEGLPLTIVTVAEILSKADKTPEYWNEVAEKENSVFFDAYEEMLEVLIPSYNYLPQYLKAPFLYMGVFLQNYEIPYSKLVNLWDAEGFLECHSDSKFLKDIYSNSLAIIHEQSYYTGTITCSLCSPIWYMCNKEAEKDKFYHCLNSLDDCLEEEGIKSHRRLCIRNNGLFCIKDVYDYVASVSNVRSLLCTGLYHPYPVPICFDYLRLLRIFDALTIRFYEFPMEVLKPVQLKYLALTYNGNLPNSIFKLPNLRYLIVYRHLRIVKSYENSSLMPIEIWEMKELKHLHVIGSNLPHPNEGSFLRNLLTLLDVSPQSCTKDVFERIPNLQKLGILVELALDDIHDDDEPLCLFDHITHLDNLKELECIVANPRIMSSEVFVAAPLSILPSSLVNLTLSGLGYAWEEMSKISSSLPNLQILKLRCYAFRGPKWEVREGEFRKLRLLLIEDADVAHLIFRDRLCLPLLQWFSIKHCYKLEEIPLEFSRYLQKIELVDCSPLAVICANKLKDDWDTKYSYHRLLDLNVHCSWD